MREIGASEAPELFDRRKREALRATPSMARGAWQDRLGSRPDFPIGCLSHWGVAAKSTMPWAARPAAC